MRTALTLALLAGAGSLALAADPAVVPNTVVQDGTVVAGAGNVTSIDNLAVNDSGTWLVEADTDNPNTAIDNTLLQNGVLILQAGDAFTLPAGATLSSFDSSSLNNNGDRSHNHFLAGLTTSTDSGVFFNDNLLIQESQVSTAGAFTFPTPYVGFFETKLNDQNQVLIMASVDDPALASTVDRALVQASVNALGQLSGEAVIVKEGDALDASGETVAELGTGPHNFDFNNNGSVMYFADLTGDTAVDGLIVIDGNIVAREGSPSPLAGRNWSSLSSPELSLNDSGEYVFSGSLDGDAASNLLIVKNGQKFVQEGDTLPDIAPFTFTSFGSGPIEIANNGDVLWYGDWNDTDTTKDKGLFLNKKLILQEGVSVVNGMTVDTIRGVEAGYAFSNNGRYAMVEVVFNGSIDGAVFIDLGPWQDLGGELAGTNGVVPHLQGTGVLTPNSPVSLCLDDALPNSSAYLIIGLSTVNLPFSGTTLVPSPDLILGPLPTGPNGRIFLTTTWPGAPSGFQAFFQYFVVDPSGPEGLSASNTVFLTTP